MPGQFAGANLPGGFCVEWFAQQIGFDCQIVVDQQIGAMVGHEQDHEKSHHEKSLRALDDAFDDGKD